MRLHKNRSHHSEPMSAWGSPNPVAPTGPGCHLQCLLSRRRFCQVSLHALKVIWPLLKISRWSPKSGQPASWDTTGVIVHSVWALVLTGGFGGKREWTLPCILVYQEQSWPQSNKWQLWCCCRNYHLLSNYWVPNILQKATWTFKSHLPWEERIEPGSPMYLDQGFWTENLCSLPAPYSNTETPTFKEIVF